MRIKWADVNWTDQPGVHHLPDGRQVQVSAIEIARWRSCPDGTFDTYWYPGTPHRPAQFTLTDFHSLSRTVQQEAPSLAEVPA